MSATVSVPDTRGWFRQLCSGRPHQTITAGGATYLHRWFVWPRCRWFNCYLHHFVGSDDPVPHDHPWPFVSLIISGRYMEVTSAGRTLRRTGSIAYRPAAYRHRVELIQNTNGRETPCWTLVFTGPRRRQWGFWCPRPDGAQRFVAWQDFGPGGCGEASDADLQPLSSTQPHDD
ncbi:hypothetical protein [Mycobacterium attenuatum]|uniref:hypothetical protein n=1 Tax=Mycobacterium attenuatum TaxID=2341086 RepID=UPI000F0258D1|nr:hypothetical protein [Mycobacterium attenuatum]VBA62307.1 hypothetical protein LAUMK41_05698 [Mycobacterium attenuatum]